MLNGVERVALGRVAAALETHAMERSTDAAQMDMLRKELHALPFPFAFRAFLSSHSSSACASTSPVLAPREMAAAVKEKEKGGALAAAIDGTEAEFMQVESAVDDMLVDDPQMMVNVIAVDRQGLLSVVEKAALG